MSTKAILILQGGGALGAYEAGAYEALVEHLNLRTKKHTLAVVAGTSIGAINASLIAKHYNDPDKDRGVAALKRFWTKELATPSWTEQLTTFCAPVVPRLFDEWQRWSAVWTSLLWGNPHLYRPDPENPIPWVFRAPFFWGNETHFYDTRVMEQTVHRNLNFEPYVQGKDDPRLIVTAVDIAKGESHLFDSCNKPRITAADVVACCSLPPMFPAKEISGSYYWDGGLWSNTPLREVLNALQSVTPIEDNYHVYIIDTFPRKGCVPRTNWQVFGRMSEITYADKTDYDRKAIEMVNEYIDLVKMLDDRGKDLPNSIQNEISSMKKDKLRHYQEIANKKRVHVDVTVIPRSAFPDERAENISREIDFSPTRINDLWDQGYREAKAQL